MTRQEKPPIDMRPGRIKTIHEISEYLHLHRSTIYRLIKRHQIPAFRIGSDWRFDIEEIDRWRLQMTTRSCVLDKEQS